VKAGDRIGPYELCRRLGEGGMGVVWEARDRRLGRGVALELLPQAVADDPESRARFEREARASTRGAGGCRGPRVRRWTKSASAASVVLLAWLTAAPPAYAQAGETDRQTATSRPAPEQHRPEGADDGRRTLKRLPANLVRGASGVFSRSSLVPLLAGVAGTALARGIDDETARPNGAGNQFGKIGDNFGRPGFVVGVAGAMFLGGRLATGQRFRDASYDILVAGTVNFLYTGALKTAFPRERPDMANDKSFPSGHTSNAFAWATVLERHYGLGVGVPMYLLAAAVGASRVTGGKHFVSDIVAGATVGFLVGRSVTRRNGETTGPFLSLVPTVGPSGQRGVVAVWQF